MAFSKALEKMRRIGRRCVLPSEKIKKILSEKVGLIDGNIIDLGAGTMYWSEWLYEQYAVPVLSVDVYYDDSECCMGGYITKYNDYFKCVSENEASALWMCDVIHHLDKQFREKVIESISFKKYEYVIIKDIDSRHRFGNFMNMVHDLVINHERVLDVNPKIIEKKLIALGYVVTYDYIPKLWYPHFLMIARKQKE